MAMLAEPRRKQKWTLNPRGKHWSEDTNKFGQKMLEKMGWTSGKGLGANEQGMTEHIRVAFKDDNAGIGFNKDHLDKAWTEHQEGFNEFLQQLQKEQNPDSVQTAEVKTDTLSGKSLELKSKQSRARVHYHKFTRGKDVNRYSSKDLANIFGQKDLDTEKNTKEEKSEDMESSEPIGTQDKRGGVITINSGSMTDYFKKKGHDFSTISKSRKDDQSTDSDSEMRYTGFGFSMTSGKDDTETQGTMKTSCNYAFVNPCLKDNSPDDTLNNQVKSAKKRKSNDYDNNESDLNSRTKKLRESRSTESNNKNCFVNPGLNLESQSDKDCNGKEYEVSRAQFGLTNSALDLTDEAKDKKRVTFNDHVEYSVDPIKKKKEKATLDKFEVENKKHKKKRKRSDDTSNSASACFVNQALDMEEISEEVNDNEFNERKSKKTKKRKSSRASLLETIAETPEEDKEVPEENLGSEELVENVEDDTAVQTVSKKMKKKKKKKEVEKANVEDADGTDINPGTELKEAEQSAPPLETIKDSQKMSTEKKKKKRSKNNDTTEVEVQEVILEGTTKEGEELAEITSNKKKNKKKKHKDVTDDISNESESAIKEKEVSDKENTNSDQKAASEEKKRKNDKKSRKSLEKSLDVSTTYSNEIVTENSIIEENSQDKSAEVSFKKDNENSEVQRVTRSPWNERARMSKKLLKSLFQRNAVRNFPGANMHEIKGYGVDIL